MRRSSIRPLSPIVVFAVSITLPSLLGCGDGSGSTCAERDGVRLCARSNDSHTVIEPQASGLPADQPVTLELVAADGERRTSSVSTTASGELPDAGFLSGLPVERPYTVSVILRDGQRFDVSVR